MIDITDLTRDDIGRWVTYRSSGGDKIERGRIRSWNDIYIFVVYNWSAEQESWMDYTAAATRPEDLEFEG